MSGTAVWTPALDASYDMPDPALAYAGGIRLIMGYLSDTPGKGMTPAYVARCAAAHMLIQPLYETTAIMALGGRSTGVTAATTATRIAAALGCPPSVPIIYALDSDYSTAQMAGPVADFIAGLDAVAGPDGLYGGYDQLDYLIVHKLDVGRLFQTYAWSGGRWLASDDAPIEQYRNGVSAWGGTVDLCRADLSRLTPWSPGDIIMPLTAADAIVLAHSDHVINNTGGFGYRADSSDHIPAPAPADVNPDMSLDTALQSIAGQAHAANVAASAALAAIQKLAGPITVPPAPAGALSDADVARVAAAVVNMLDARLAS